MELPEGTLRGHTYHHSLTSTALDPIARGLSPNGGRGNEAVYRLGRLTASYVHFYFPSNPPAIAALLAPCAVKVAGTTMSCVLPLIVSLPATS